MAVDVLPDVPTVQPRLESDADLMSIGIGRSLEDSYRQAHTHMVAWISHLTGLGQLDAYQWLSQAGTARVGNVAIRPTPCWPESPKTSYRQACRCTAVPISGYGSSRSRPDGDLTFHCR